ncbi:MAG: homocysteine S-methyltransferase family protein [Clostridiaceae bacterium]|nr:homocysteine S-methyltransferase family protein [Clostridiaceae bacterium]
MSFKEKLGKELLIFDGAMGTILQKNGLVAGELPELWNFKNEELISGIHKQYIEAGADIITTNTFGANSLKLDGSGYSVDAVVKKACSLARKAADDADKKVYVALDMGPTGKLLEPYGDLPFENAYELYKEQILAGKDCGVDFVLLETMGDLYEIKAAVLAAKENCELPIVVSMIFNEKGQLLTGADIKTAVFTLEGLGVDGIGLNCGLGPKQMKDFVGEALKYTSLPLTVNPNAGLPECVNGVTSYNVLPEEFSDDMADIVRMGASAVGGCCGTAPEHIKATAKKCRNIAVCPVNKKHFTAVTSYSKTVIMGGKTIIIGERINPTGKKKLKEALRNNDLDYIVSEAVAQADKNSDVLDVNVGLPEIDEAEMLSKAVRRVQSVVNLPLQIDTADASALEKALRIYNGKPLINSVNGKEESMNAVFPLAKKYGGVTVCLTLDENGIPETAEGRIEIAEKIIAKAESYGISKDNLIFDTLTLTVSTGSDNAKITLDALDYIRHTLGVNTVLGVSNISFGLPSRESINTAFFTMALQRGLSAGIVNPLSEDMMNAYYSYCALAGFDDNCENYIRSIVKTQAAETAESISLKQAIIKGMNTQSATLAKELLKSADALEIINSEIIPALDEVGQGFENGTVFLPQLLQSADCAKAAFDEIKFSLSSSGKKQETKGRIVLCTVKGDIHDIGKNIVKVLLENYGFDVIDLGKDVAPETVLKAVIDNGVRLVGLSALMTTTVVSMQETIDLLKRELGDITVCVGGAVLNQEYADSIGADFYSKDAMGTVRFAEKFFS